MIHKKTIYIIIGSTIISGAILYLSVKDILNFKKRANENKKTSCKKNNQYCEGKNSKCC